MKKLLFAAFALVIAVSVSAFVSKTETAPKKEKATSVLYWYRVTYNAQNPGGTILSSSDFHVQDEKADVDSPCDPGSGADCLRGFSNPIPSNAFPYDMPGADQIQKP